MKKVYIVTAGEYSSYQICAVFSTKPLAEKFCELYDSSDEWGEGDIEEWELDNSDCFIPTMTVYMSREGEVAVIYKATPNDSHGGFYMFDAVGNLVWYVKTDDETKAIKVVNEKRVQILALNIWGNYRETEKLVH